MATTQHFSSSSGASHPKLATFPLIVGAATVVLLAAWTARHLGQAREFARLTERAEPWWLLLAIAFQVATYIAAGAIWQRVAHSSKRHLSLPSVARLSLVKLSVDQLMPSGGLAGSMVVARALQRLGLPAAMALEALFVDLLAYYAAFAAAVMLALLVLWLHHGVTAAVIAAVGAFSVVLVTVPALILWLLEHGKFQPPRCERPDHAGLTSSARAELGIHRRPTVPPRHFSWVPELPARPGNESSIRHDRRRTTLSRPNAARPSKRPFTKSPRDP